MSFSNALYVSWQSFCAAELGRPVDINLLEHCMLSHVVPAGQPPLSTAEGAVRKLSMVYELEDLDNEFPN